MCGRCSLDCIDRCVIASCLTELCYCELCPACPLCLCVCVCVCVCRGSYLCVSTWVCVFNGMWRGAGAEWQWWISQLVITLSDLSRSLSFLGGTFNCGVYPSIPSGLSHARPFAVHTLAHTRGEKKALSDTQTWQMRGHMHTRTVKHTLSLLIKWVFVWLYATGLLIKMEKTDWGRSRRDEENEEDEEEEEEERPTCVFVKEFSQTKDSPPAWNIACLLDEHK